MEISFILLNYKQKGLVKQSIKGIYQCRILLPYEIIVIDNNSQDGTIEMLKNEFPEVNGVSMPKNIGFAAGNNAGIKISKGKYIVIMNPDTALTKNAIEDLVNFLKSHPKAGMVGPKLINPDGTIQYSCRRFPNFLIPVFRRTIIGKFPFSKKAIDAYLMKDWSHQDVKKVCWLFGALLVIKKEVLDQVGMFDENFFLYYEDLDLCRRFWERGYEVWYYPLTELVHYHQRLSAQKSGIFSIFDKTTRIHISSGIKYFVKYFGKENPQKP